MLIADGSRDTMRQIMVLVERLVVFGALGLQQRRYVGEARFGVVSAGSSERQIMCVRLFVRLSWLDFTRANLT